MGMWQKNELDLAGCASENNGEDTSEEFGISGRIKKLTRIADLYAVANNTISDQRLQSIIHHMCDAVILVDSKLKIHQINQAAINMLRLSSEDIESYFQKPKKNNISTNFDKSLITRCINGECLKNHNIEITYSDGKKRYIIMHGTPICNNDGKPDMAMLVARDITELKELQMRTQKMLSQISRHESSLRHLINEIPAGVMLLDSDLCLLASNKHYLKYFDEPHKWKIGAPLADVLPLAEESGIASYIRTAINTNKPLAVTDFRYDGFSKGTTYWTGSAVPIRWQSEEGLIRGVAMIMLDVTDEILARERLAELAALAERRAAETEVERIRLRTIIEAAPVPLIVCDGDMNTLAYNSAGLKLVKSLGYAKWLINKDSLKILGEMEAINEDGTPLDFNEHPVKKSLRGEICKDHIMKCRTKSGCIKILSINCAPIKDQNGWITGVVQAISDITEKVSAQEQIREVYKREHAIAEKLQKSYIPYEHLKADGFDLAQRYRPALDEAMVGGDFYDVFQLRNGQFGIVIGDVAGKGLKAAVYTAMTKYMLRAYALEQSAPDLVLARLNEALSACTPSEVFVTLVYGILDHKTMTFTYANAGHEQPLYYSKQTGTAITLDVTGRALALAKGASYSIQTTYMNPGDVIMLYTDGITDAGSGADRLGQKEVLRVIECKADNCVDKLADIIMNTALDYGGGFLSDDAALLIVRCNAQFF